MARVRPYSFKDMSWTRPFPPDVAAMVGAQRGWLVVWAITAEYAAHRLTLLGLTADHRELRPADTWSEPQRLDRARVWPVGTVLAMSGHGDTPVVSIEPTEEWGAVRALRKVGQIRTHVTVLELAPGEEEK